MGGTVQSDISTTTSVHALTARLSVTQHPLQKLELVLRSARMLSCPPSDEVLHRRAA